MIRPREGLSPTSPQWEAGTRVDPAPSLASTKGTMRDASAAAAPPLEPPGVRSRFQGLLVRPKSAGSVARHQPNSGALLRPSSTNPACLIRRV